ncbi:MAG: DUF4302 domain-containing protein [Prevotellaceae bacterium]|jgi:hypothetical protein|nr:DUF4302 domain-containing protein [Prevotellaceae bacterium]
MKNKFLLIVLLAFVALQACVKDEEKIFNASAAERTNETVNSLRNLLVSLPNGWMVEYYPEPDRSMGGYNFIWKFDTNGTVVVAGEQATANYPEGDTLRSHFDVIANRGVVLSFNTYNEVFHYFSEPSYNDLDGYGGDYEFVLREMTPEKIVMTGKKRGNRLVLTPYTGGDASTWKPYLEQFAVLHSKMTAADYTVSVNGTAAADFDKVTRKHRVFRLTYKNPDNNKIVPYILTPTGIKLYEPLTVDGETVQYFTFNEAEKKLTGEGAGHITIELGPPPPPLNVWFATMKSYGYFLLKGSNSVMALVDQCSMVLGNNYGETLVGAIVGDSPLPRDPGRGFIFISHNPSIGHYYYSQFIFDFIPEGNNLRIEYANKSGADGAWYEMEYAQFRREITRKSPYSITANDPVFPDEVILTSVADPDFYFMVSDFGK